MKKDLLSLKFLSNEEIMGILEDARKFRDENMKLDLSDKIIANLFFENSTRTQYSFITAEEKLNAKVLHFNAQGSSMSKGETFYDTVKVFESFGCDAVVIRSAQNEYYNELKGLNCAIINAGDGTENHPTQNLLDLLTIYDEFGHFDGLKIMIVGDILHSRVAHGNVEVMKRLGMKCYISGPKEFMDDTAEYIDFDKGVKECDVIMMLRIQTERHAVLTTLSDKEYNLKYGMNEDRVNLMKDNAIIMHPAPFNRGVEVDDYVPECNKSRIFRQMTNGVYVRMAAIKRSLGN